MGDYMRPETLDEALAALGAGPRSILAGGTDLYPASVGRPLDGDILDITAIVELGGLELGAGGLRIGALARWSELAAAVLPPAFDGLKAAARQIGGAQVQNAGTICGNVCNASPAADGIPNLMVLDASVELAGTAGRRSVPVGDFVTGNRQTVRRPDELVVGITVPAPPGDARGAFEKLGARRYLVISIVMVAGLVVPAADGTVGEARIAVGACSPVAQRLDGLETALAGVPMGPGLAEIPRAEHLAPLAPLDDVRGTAAYRLGAVLTLTRRLLAGLAP